MATVTATAATSVTATSAQLNGLANPQGSGLFVWFEYGLTTSYGQQTAEVYVGNGSGDVAVSAGVSGLLPGRPYHFRVVGEAGSPPPPGTYGFDLPDRLPESAGATTNVASLAALTSALGTVAAGSTINITANLVGAGQIYQLARVASAGAPITITCDPGVTITGFGQWNVRGAYLRLRGLDIGYATIDGIKIDTAAHDIEVDGCTVHHAARQGINLQPTPTNVQIWNNRVHHNGSVANGQLDHGMYIGTVRGVCVIANNECFFNRSYNLQLYPDSPGTIVTCNTFDGQDTNPSYPHGGVVVGSETGTEDNVLLVGNLMTNAPGWGVQIYNPSGGDSGNQAFDCLGYGNGAGDFEAGTGMTYTNCTHASSDPYVNQATRDYHLVGGSPAISKIQPARYGYVPPLDIDGNPRVTADAGCYAA